MCEDSKRGAQAKLAGATGSIDAAAHNTRALRVLIVDDNQDAADMLADVLTIGGHDVRVVYDGLEALTALCQFNAHVVLLDIGLPGIDGWEVARRMRAVQRCSRLRIIAVTGYGQEQDRQRSRQAGIDHHLVKPANLTALEVLIHDPA